MTAIFPSQYSFTGTETSAGMFMLRARIAVWEFGDPCSVINPSSMSFSSWTVSLGARSSAIRITGFVRKPDSTASPERIFSSRSVMSFTSAARARKYSSSMSAKSR